MLKIFITIRWPTYASHLVAAEKKVSCIKNENVKLNLWWTADEWNHYVKSFILCIPVMRFVVQCCSLEIVEVSHWILSRNLWLTKCSERFIFLERVTVCSSGKWMVSKIRKLYRNDFDRHENLDFWRGFNLCCNLQPKIGKYEIHFGPLFQFCGRGSWNLIQRSFVCKYSRS